MVELKKENTGMHEVLTLLLYADGLTIRSKFKNIEDIKKLLSDNKNVYKIEAIKTKENHSINSVLETHNVETKKLPLWVADEITNVKKIKRSNPRFDFFPKINSMNLNVPAIQTGIHTVYSVGMKELAAIEPCVFPVSTTVFWHELDNNDIVVNKDMKQVYPKTTGKIPEVLAKMLQNVR
ncbi:MAG: hypothetical protein R8M71_04910 [Alphaproteobacteria bacterium]|nr:hypothetical protein [Alphaproteobacteria bacterium]